MKTFKTVQLQSQEVEQIVCNMCGCVIQKETFGYLDTFVSVNKTWNYGTGWDGETHSFDLCEGCYDKLIAGFKIAPKPTPEIPCIEQEPECEEPSDKS
ncbi:MAG: hypothetical protein LBQ68_07190 [Clostridiales bacterium]|nr:hypothetical protein [Clostridiales bacterium]